MSTERDQGGTMKEHGPSPLDTCCSRRDFLRVVGAAGATIGVGAGMGGLLAACGEEAETTTTAGPATTAAPTTTTSPETTATAGPEMGREIKVGWIAPLTGSLASSACRQYCATRWTSSSGWDRLR